MKGRGLEERLAALEAEKLRLATELRQSRRQGIEARACNRAKDRFLAVLGHELRNPLAPILTATELLWTTPGLPREARDRLAVIDRNVRLQVRLIDDLLDTSRLLRGKLRLDTELVDVHTLVDDVAVGFACDRGSGTHEIRVQLEAPEHHVVGDPARLNQIVSNLVRNACEHTPPGCSVAVTTDSDGEHLLLRVVDDGPGLDPGAVEDLFRPFEQSLPPGSRRGQLGLGLGLPIARGLAEAHGGELIAFPDEDGAVFELRLPLADSFEISRAPTAKEPVRSPRHILVVEDSRDAAEMLAALLTAAGHQAYVAFDGASGIESARELEPDVVLCDIGLPDIDGLEVARVVRSALGDRPLLVAISGFGQNEDIDRAREAGFDAHLTKPVSRAALEELMERQHR